MALLHDVLVSPDRTRTLDAGDWDLLVRQARHSNLLGRLHHFLSDQGLALEGPQRARHHLRSAATMAARQHQSVRYEAGLLRKTLAELGLPLILLKGAAYVLAGLPAARGRVFADVDILVPKSRLTEVESALMLIGWVSVTADAYDQRYYRRWMHELPALQHIHRGTALDVHHTILPPTSGIRIDTDALIESSVEVNGWPGVRTLGPQDMVLHSAAHLFHDGEPDNLLRDLSDLDLLLRHFGQDPLFWPSLTAHAEQRGMAAALRLALRYARQFLATPVPHEVLAKTRADRSLSPASWVLDAMYRRVLSPMHSSASDWATGSCRKLLYIRAHWQRMPPHLLAYHLIYKALIKSEVLAENVAQRR